MTLHHCPDCRRLTLRERCGACREARCAAWYNADCPPIDRVREIHALAVESASREVRVWK